MRKYLLSIILPLIISVFTVVCLSAQKVTEPRADKEWTREYQPFRIVGNLYYVGTYDLASVKLSVI
jgi:metallo-beta-lactamase class B